MKSVYIETSIASYMTSRPSRDVRAIAWQQLTVQWWNQERKHYELYTSALVMAESAEGDPDAAQRRQDFLCDLPELIVDTESEILAARLVDQGGFPPTARADALHVAVAAVHGIDYLLTWNCRHINNAAMKPLIRSVCAAAGYNCPEICTPQELLWEDENHVSG